MKIAIYDLLVLHHFCFQAKVWEVAIQTHIQEQSYFDLAIQECNFDIFLGIGIVLLVQRENSPNLQQTFFLSEIKVLHHLCQQESLVWWQSC